MQWALKSISTQSALNPLIWSFSIVMICTTTVVLFQPGLFAWAFFTIAAIFGSAILLAYHFWSKTSPDRLHSEKYQIDMYRLQRGMMGDDVSGPAVIEHQEMTTNPAIEDVNDDREPTR